MGIRDSFWRLHPPTGCGRASSSLFPQLCQGDALQRWWKGAAAALSLRNGAFAIGGKFAGGERCAFSSLAYTLRALTAARLSSQLAVQKAAAAHIRRGTLAAEACAAPLARAMHDPRAGSDADASEARESVACTDLCLHSFGVWCQKSHFCLCSEPVGLEIRIFRVTGARV